MYTNRQAAYCRIVSLTHEKGEKTAKASCNQARNTLYYFYTRSNRCLSIGMDQVFNDKKDKPKRKFNWLHGRTGA